ncbi:MAG: hypothetical protein A2538_04165 [Candidatus Magasanikbacteria bacterium RIFOXYD2_FULL_41_14]|uniref:AtpZ/AtpI family protein n=1 Tax=Candidatus Magasanikbacteria bacterium RIFOXYD2_FULL_41_14 TaxID=1798709 RepID=A0A1F6PC42_9BACT|nr:MAG: hypothetical protein A2538_04165 [Candidatus Magasanikbacteria bacterium RIFOXYD2_FULL_41_14]
MTEQPKTSDRTYYLFALRIVGDFGASIAVPAVLAALIGNWLDEKFTTYPLFVVLCLAVAALLTAKSITKKSKKYGEEYNKLK